MINNIFGEKTNNAIFQFSKLIFTVNTTIISIILFSIDNYYMVKFFQIFFVF